MSLNPITREEKFLAKAGGEDVGELKPITRKEMFLDRLAGGGSGGSGGGSIAWDDIKDKPFGEEVEIIVPETVVTFADGAAVIENGHNFKVDEIYNVILDGVTYECVVMDDDDCYMFWQTVDAPLPFEVYINAYEDNNILLYDDAATHKVSITRNTIKTLDPKFLPAAGGGSKMVVNMTMTEDYEMLIDKTYEEIKQAIHNGTEVVMKSFIDAGGVALVFNFAFYSLNEFGSNGQIIFGGISGFVENDTEAAYNIIVVSSNNTVTQMQVYLPVNVG